MTSNFSKSKKKPLFMRISTILCIDCSLATERGWGDRKRKHTGDASSFPIPSFPERYFYNYFILFYLFYFTFYFWKSSENLYRRLTAFTKPFFRIIFLIRKKKRRHNKNRQERSTDCFHRFFFLFVFCLVFFCPLQGLPQLVRYPLWIQWNRIGGKDILLCGQWKLEHF